MTYSAPCSLQPQSALGLERSGVLYMSVTMMRRLGLSDGTATTLCVPGSRISVHVASLPADPFGKPESKSEERVYIASKLMQRLGLPAGRPLNMRRTLTGELHVGPFVGIFCQRYPGPSLYGPQTRFFRRLIQMGRAMGMFVYVFETTDVDRRSATIYGSTWVQGRGWVRGPYPLPHVLYDRGMVNDAVVRAHRWLRLRGVRQFNSYVGSKLWVYRLMAQSPELARYIPETRVLRRTGDLALMLRKHGIVYVKSANGGKGIGIWVISQDSGGGYTFRFTDSKARIHRGRTSDVSSVALRLLSAPRQPWIIQPRIDLLRWRGRIFDVRVLVQRDGQGELLITGTGARIGRQGSIISNIFGGGDARPLQPLLQESLGISSEAAAHMHREIERISMTVARLIDRAARRTGTIGELGIDIAIDRKGRLWFLEANSRTGRNVFGMAGMHESAQAAMERPLQYAEYVAGFGRDVALPTG